MGIRRVRWPFRGGIRSGSVLNLASRAWCACVSSPLFLAGGCLPPLLVEETEQSSWNGRSSSVSRFHGGRWSVPSRRLLKQKRDEIAARYASGRTKFDATVTVHLQASFLFLLMVNPAFFLRPSERRGSDIPVAEQGIVWSPQQILQVLLNFCQELHNWYYMFCCIPHDFVLFL